MVYTNLLSYIMLGKEGLRESFFRTNLRKEKSRGEVSSRSTPAFAGLAFGEFGGYRVSIKNGGSFTYEGRVYPFNSFLDTVPRVLDRAARTDDVRIVAAGLANANGRGDRLMSELWLHHGIVSHFQPLAEKIDPKVVAQEVASKYTPDGIANIQLDPVTREITPSRLVSLDYYQKADPQAIAQARFYAEKLKEFGNDRIVHISSTPQGGGVAIMRHAEMRLAREMGLNMHWHVMEPDGKAFEVTKRKFHNIFQGVQDAGERLEEPDKQTYQKWIKQNAALLEPTFKDAKVLVIDDPQPSGLIPYALKANPDLTILYRSHIEIINSLTDDPATPQHELWNYLWYGDPLVAKQEGFDPKTMGIQAAHAFITHPVKSFVPTDVPVERVFGMAPTTDRFDGLNKPLSTQEQQMYMGQINELLKSSEQGEQAPIDLSRPYVSQRARLDPSKGYPDLMEAFKITWDQMRSEEKTLPQLVMIANRAADDPDATRVYEELLGKLNSPRFSYMKDDIKIIRAPHNDLLLNAVTRGSRFVTQLSVREGFEFNVEEAIMKGIPVIGTTRGGIPLQIEEGAGHLVDPGQKPEAYYKEVAKHMYDLFTNDALHAHMSKVALESAHDDFKTERNVANWQWLAFNAVDQIRKNGAVMNGNYGKDDADSDGGYVPRMVEASFARDQEQLTSRRRHKTTSFFRAV